MPQETERSRVGRLRSVGVRSPAKHGALEDGNGRVSVGRRPPRLEGGKAESKPEIEPALAARQNAVLGRSRANAPARPGAELVATLTKSGGKPWLIRF